MAEIAYMERADSVDISNFTGEEKRVLEEINRRVAAGRNMDEILDFVFTASSEIMPCDRLGVGFIEEGGGRLSLKYVKASYAPLHLDEGYSADSAGSSLAKVFSEGTPRIIEDLEAYYEKNPGSESTRLILKEGVRSSMTCPLMVEGRAVGILFRSSRKAKAYGPREVNLHLAIAERLSQAVEKAYMIDRLSDSMNSYMEMLGFVSHELKSPVSSTITMAKTMLGGYYGELEDKQKDFLSRMVRQNEYLLNLISEYLNLSRFESGRIEPSFRQADFIKEVVDTSIDIVLPQANEKNIIIERNEDELPEITCDPDLLKIVTGNLLSNGVKYGIDGGLVKVNVSKVNDDLLFSVWNEGPGFSAEQKKKLFKKFSRLDSPELMKRKGSGVGLYVSWKIIQIHGGRMKADSVQGEYAEFSFRIPVKGPEETGD